MEQLNGTEGWRQGGNRGASGGLVPACPRPAARLGGRLAGCLPARSMEQVYGQMRVEQLNGMEWKGAGAGAGSSEVAGHMAGWSLHGCPAACLRSRLAAWRVDGAWGKMREDS